MFSCEELQSHLREVIEPNGLSGLTSSSPNEHHHFRQIENWQQRVAEEKTAKLGNKLNQARMKQQARSSQSLLDLYLENPELLVGHRNQTLDETNKR